MSVVGPVQFLDLEGGSLGFRVQGTGPKVVHVGNWLTNADTYDFVPALERYASLGSFAQVAYLDMPGSGSSDSLRGCEIGQRADWIDTFDALLDALSWDSATFLGWDMATHPMLTYAAAHPHRIDRLILLNPTVGTVRNDDFPFGIDPADVGEFVDAFMELYGTPDFLRVLAPSGVADDASCQGWARWQRASAPPARARRLREILCSLSSADLLEAIRVPASVMESRHDSLLGAQGRWLSERISGAEYLELPYEDFFPVAESDMAALLGEVEQVLTGSRQSAPVRQLLAVLFSDIVSSTERAVEVGDRRWRQLIAAHVRGAQSAVERAGGRFVKSTGDGALAVFPSITSALEGASALHDQAARDGLLLRIGVHPGDVELVQDDVAGVTVHIAARIQAHAPPGGTALAAATAALGADPALSFEELTTTVLKGLPGEWPLVAVTDRRGHRSADTRSVGNSAL